MTTKPTRSTGRLIAAWAVAVVLGAVGILIAAQIPLALPSVISGFVILIVGVVLGILIAIRRPDRGAEAVSSETGESLPTTRRIRQAFYGSRSADSDRLGTALRASGTVGVGILGPQPGPFDSPPDEDVELDPKHVPWELQDAAEPETQPESTEQSDRKRQ